MITLLTRLARLILMFWLCAFAVLIMTMFAANMALSHH